MLTSNMSGGSCAATRLTSRLANPGVRATTRTLRPKPPMLLASMSPRPRRPLCYAWTKSLQSRLWSERRLSEVAQWPRLDRPEPRLQAAWHDNTVCGARSRDRKDHRGSFKTASSCRVSRLHEQRHRSFSEPPASRHPRQSQHPQEERALAQGAPQCAISFHADKCVLAQSGRGMVLDLAGTVAQRCLLHKPQTAPGAHRCLHQRL